MPPRSEFARLGLTVKQELHGGFQSRVLRVAEHRSDGTRDLALKLIDGRGSERSLALERLRVRDRAARLDDRVMPIASLAGRKANRVGDCLAIASPFIEGRIFDITHRPDVERMGRVLARLHQSLRLISAEVPVVAPLRAGEPVEGLLENHQLLHGDFSPANLLLDDDGRVWIFDFDDCGYGPVEFELGNTLFMALFDTSPSLNQPSVDYRNFRHWFIGSYQASAERQISELLVDLAVQARSSALRYWLRNLDEAPIGIRASTSQWRKHLAAFAGRTELPGGRRG